MSYVIEGAGCTCAEDRRVLADTAATAAQLLPGVLLLCGDARIYDEDGRELSFAELRRLAFGRQQN